MSYKEASNFNVSEKISLAWMEPSRRISSGWLEGDSGVYSAEVPYWVIGVAVNAVSLIQVESLLDLEGDCFYFDHTTKTIYVKLAESGNPKVEWTQVTFRLFFSDRPIILPFDLEDGVKIPYEPLIASTVQGGARFDPKEPEIAIEGSGSITLHNSDGFFQPIFDRLTWQSQGIKLFSAIIDPRENYEYIRIFDGLITSQQYSPEAVSFSGKDYIYRLRSLVDLPLFSSSDGRIPDSLIGKPKRRIYGRVRGLRSESLDRRLSSYPAKVVDGYGQRTSTPITGSLTTGSTLVVATDPSIIDEMCANDRVIIGDHQFDIETIGRIKIGLERERQVTFEKVGGTNPNVILSFDDIDTSDVTDSSDFIAISLLPGASASLQDRLRGVWHIVSKASDSITFATDDNTGFSTEEFKASIGEIAICKGGAINQFYVSEEAVTTQGDLPINIIPTVPYRRLNRKHLIAGHALHEVEVTVEMVRSSTAFVVSDVSNLRIGDIITIDGTKLNTIVSILPDTNDIRVQDGVNPLPQVGEVVKRVSVQRVSFQATNFIPLRDYTVENTVEGATLTFDNRAEENVVTRSSAGLSILTTGSRAIVSLGATFTDLKARDWIRVSNESEWYEVDEVLRNEIILLKQPYLGDSGTKATIVKRPTYIDDRSSIFIDSYGITDNGLPSGNLIQTGAQGCLHVLNEVGISNIDELSFAEGSITSPYLISVAIPKQANLAPVTYRGLLNRFNSSTLGTIFVGDDYNVKYGVISAERLHEDALYLSDFDIISDSITADSSNLIAKITANYRFQDLDEDSEEPANQTLVLESEFINNSGVDGQIRDIDLYLFEEADAETIASRIMFMTELPKSDVTLSGKMNLNNVFLNDIVVYSGSRAYERYGSSDNRRIGMVTEVRRGTTNSRIQISDLGGIFARVGVISEQEIDGFISYITDDSGIVEDDDALGINLIG